MITPLAIAGYIVLDDGRPVVRIDLSRGLEYWPKHKNGIAPVALFRTISEARKAKRSIQRRHRDQANRFDPKHGSEDQRCFDLWTRRAKEVRISAVRLDDAKEAAR